MIEFLIVALVTVIAFAAFYVLVAWLAVCVFGLLPGLDCKEIRRLYKEHKMKESKKKTSYFVKPIGKKYFLEVSKEVYDSKGDKEGIISRAVPCPRTEL